MSRFGFEGGLSKRGRREIDQQHRDSLVSLTDDRMIEAIGADLLRAVELFGSATVVTKIRRDSGETVRLYRPDAEARTAGYVPLLWIEFGGNNLQDGCFLEIWHDQERLIEAVDTPDGKKPSPLPIQNSRVMTVKALNIAQEGTLEEPCHQARV